MIRKTIMFSPLKILDILLLCPENRRNDINVSIKGLSIHVMRNTSALKMVEMYKKVKCCSYGAEL